MAAEPALTARFMGWAKLKPFASGVTNLQRNMDLIRQIMLQVEQNNGDVKIGKKFRVGGYDDVVVAKHVELLGEAGLIQAHFIKTDVDGVIEAYVKRLTWSGHEFLDAARNEAVWKKTKAIVKQKVGTVSFEVLKTLLIEISKSLLDLS